MTRDGIRDYLLGWPTYWPSRRDEEIRRLTEARAYLAGALLCRYDHPATDCKVVGAEIDRRLSMS